MFRGIRRKFSGSSGTVSALCLLTMERREGVSEVRGVCLEAGGGRYCSPVQYRSGQHPHRSSRRHNIPHQTVGAGQRSLNDPTSPAIIKPPNHPKIVIRPQVTSLAAAPPPLQPHQFTIIARFTPTPIYASSV